MSTALFILHKVCINYKAMIMNLLLIIYCGLIYQLLYCILVWRCASKADMEKLFRILKRDMLCIGNIELTESCRPLFTEVRITTIFSTYICETMLCNRENCNLYWMKIKTQSIPWTDIIAILITIMLKHANIHNFRRTHFL
jgi:hypothetical protein